MSKKKKKYIQYHPNQKTRLSFDLEKKNLQHGKHCCSSRPQNESERK